MNVNIQDVLFWMDAIRNSEDQYRTLESFWKGQVNSKIWLIENLQPFVSDKSSKIVIHGGWNGVLSCLFFNSKISVKHLINVDKDPVCKEIAETVNKRYEIEGRFSHVVGQMEDFEYNEKPDIVVNTSCEHLTQHQYNEWLLNVPRESLIVLQSNNFFELDEHVRCSNNSEEFKQHSFIDTFWEGELQLPLYTRWMIIGKKCTH